MNYPMLAKALEPYKDQLVSVLTSNSRVGADGFLVEVTEEYVKIVGQHNSTIHYVPIHSILVFRPDKRADAK